MNCNSTNRTSGQVSHCTPANMISVFTLGYNNDKAAASWLTTLALYVLQLSHGMYVLIWQNWPLTHRQFSILLHILTWGVAPAARSCSRLKLCISSRQISPCSAARRSQHATCIPCTSRTALHAPACELALECARLWVRLLPTKVAC